MPSTEIQCPCGHVRVRLDGTPQVQFYCHCDDCQAVSGGAYLAAAIYPKDAVQVLEGELDTFTLKTMPRARCATCGTHMLAYPPVPDIVGVKADRLPPTAFGPQFHINCAFARLPVRDALPHYKGFPAAFGGSDETVDW